MKLLSNEELNGLDSTSETIKKWDTFLKQGIHNLGFRQDVIDNMYPYEKGIPLKNGGYLPVSKKTGRVFFKMSWAEKLMLTLSAIRSNGYMESLTQTLKITCLSLFLYNYDTFKMLFGEDKEDVFTELRSQYAIYENESMVTKDTPLKKIKSNIMPNKEATDLWKKFIEDSKVSLVKSHAVSYKTNEADHELIPDIDESPSDFNILEYLKNANGGTFSVPSGSCFFIYNEKLKDCYSTFPRELMRTVINNFSSNSNCIDILKRYDEVYQQDYLVISLNPIDKFMCSTKQAFGSCMSIAKQDDTSGTNSSYALNLPALFVSDSVFLTFMTPGKHKNMYWDQEEWLKDPANRDREKAYKYLKMTCRALTYQCTPLAETKKAWKQIPEDFRKTLNLDLSTPRLLVGRQYASAGEDFIWEEAIEYLMAKEGISTGMAYANDYKKYSRKIINQSYIDSSDITDNLNAQKYLRKGELIDTKIIMFDRYGYSRSVYLDNVRVINTSIQFAGGLVGNSKENYSCLDNDAKAIVTTSNSRVGSGGGFSGICPSSSSNSYGRCDMFKVLLGKQSYRNVNTYVRICDRCGEVLEGDETMNVTKHNSFFCKKCREELNLKVCDYCGLLYSKEDEEEHKLYNIRKVTFPDKYKSMEPKFMCKHQLIGIIDKTKNDEEENERQSIVRRIDSSSRLCLHCEEIKSGSYNYVSYFTAKLDDLNIRVGICTKCASKAVICDKCKRLIFIEDVSEACLLLPKRKIVCPDCVDKIRMKKNKKEELENMLKNLSKEDVESTETNITYNNINLSKEDPKINEEHSALKSYCEEASVAWRKDVIKQVTSMSAAGKTEIAYRK